LRRKRRQSTQIFKTNIKSPSFAQTKKHRAGWLRGILFIFLLAAIGTVSYYTYINYYHPLPDQGHTTKTGVIVPDLPAAAAASAEKETGTEEVIIPPPLKKIQVEILNGCGKEGVAKIFQTYLQEQGFDVVNTENYIENGKRRWDVAESMVIDQTGQHDSQAKEIARSLGITSRKIISKTDANAVYDISVVVGRDYIFLKAVTGKKR
jgi:hypothetical protein